MLAWMKWLTFSRRDAVRAGVAGSEAVAARSAAQVLFHAGGSKVLPASLQRAVRGAVEREASRVLAGVGLLEAGSSAMAQAAEATAVRSAAAQAARAAGRQVLRSVGAAAGAGALIDGGFAFFQVVGRVRRGALTRRQAAGHVAREAATGAAATAAGTAAAVMVVALTGGVGAPAVFLVGAAASAGVKAALDAWLVARSSGAIRAQLLSGEA
jgi:hypothetical protein